MRILAASLACLFAVEYRLTDTVTLDETIRDAAAAIRWTRERERTIGVDPATMETAAEFLPAGADITDYEPRLNINGRLPPTLIIQGDADTLVLPAQSEAYHDALTNAGVDSTLYMVEGVEHRFLEDGAKAKVTERLLQFVNELGWMD